MMALSEYAYVHDEEVNILISYRLYLILALAVTCISCAGFAMASGDGNTTIVQSSNQTAVNGSVQDPVCKMLIDPATASATSTVDGKTYYFCSEMCKGEFDTNPEKFVENAGNIQEKGSKTDPVCGMSVDPGSAHNTTYQGKVYNFCSEMCRQEFIADPEKYLPAGNVTLPPQNS